MQIGFINLSQEELAKKNKVLQMVRDQTAIDELGFGRIRDAFANLMFPGMSTLQRRAKYFVVMPSLYYQASKKTYRNIRDVHSQITKWEINLTQMLVTGAGNNESDKNGITGRSMLEAAKKDSSKFVKYDPTYIYMSGLRTYGMVKSDSDVHRIIYELSSRSLQEKPKYKASEAEEMSDSDDLSGLQQLFSVSGETYDFEHGTSLSLELTKKEAAFLKNHIVTSPRSQSSLLAYILRNNIAVLPEYDSLDNLWSTLPESFNPFYVQYRMGRRFSHLAYIIQLRYNHIVKMFNEQSDDANEIQTKIETVIREYPDDFTVDAINEMLFFIYDKVSEKSGIDFAKNAIRFIVNKEWTKLDDLIVAREKAVKPGRNKLRNPKYKGENHVDAQPMSFRWNEIVYKVITEIRNAK